MLELLYQNKICSYKSRVTRTDAMEMNILYSFMELTCSCEQLSLYAQTSVQQDNTFL